MAATDPTLIVDAIDAAIYALRAGNYVQSYTLPDGRNLSRMDLKTLLEVRQTYASLAGAAQGQGGRRTFGQLGRPQ